MEVHYSTGQSPQRTVVPMEEEEDKLRHILYLDRDYYKIKNFYAR